MLYVVLLQAQEDYERRLKEEIDAKIAKEQEIERLVSQCFTNPLCTWTNKPSDL